MQNWVETTIENSVAHLRFVRGGSNALDPSYITQINQALLSIVSNNALQALVITSKGKAFSVGGDLSFFAANLNTFTVDLDYAIRQLNEAIELLAGLPIPVVVGIHGGVGGGSLGFLGVADFVIAAPNTRFATGYADIGLCSDGGNSWFLPHLVGMRRAKELLLDNRSLDADTALEWGLINRIECIDNLEEACLEKAQQMVARSAYGLGQMKQLLTCSVGQSLSAQLQAERQAMVSCAAQANIKAKISVFSALKNKQANKLIL